MHFTEELCQKYGIPTHPSQPVGWGQAEFNAALREAIYARICASFGKGAWISECGRYRYVLWRIEDLSKPLVNFVMLNPSTADAVVDDRTIGRCLGFNKRWDCGGIVVTNLFAFRATEPKDMRQAEDPIGVYNNPTLLVVGDICQMIVCCWGNHGDYLNRDEIVRHRLREVYGVKMFSIGQLSKQAQPKHPLYLKADEPLVAFG